MITSFARTLILYFFIILCLRIMGKRQLGELQPSELVTSILISDLAAVPMQDLGIPLLQGVVPILTLFSAEMLISAFSARSIRFRSFFCGRTSILIRNGEIDQRELARQRINVTELLEELRLKDIFDLREVKYACLETNGALTIQPDPAKRPVTAGQLHIDTGSEPAFFTVLIAQGRVLTANLQGCGRDEAWLGAQLRSRGLERAEQVYLMLTDDRGGVVLVPRSDGSPDRAVRP